MSLLCSIKHWWKEIVDEDDDVIGYMCTVCKEVKWL